MAAETLRELPPQATITQLKKQAKVAAGGPLGRP